MTPVDSEKMNARVFVLLLIATCPAASAQDTSGMEKMLQKAIYKIIMGNLSSGDILLLNSFNYTLDQVLAIRQRELSKSSDVSEDLEVEAYNRQAIYDYEHLADKMEQEQDLHEDHSQESQVIFKIRAEDLTDEENFSTESPADHTPSRLPLPYAAARARSQGSDLPQEHRQQPAKEFQGLEWVEDDVYRVIPEALNEDFSTEGLDSLGESLQTVNLTDHAVTSDSLGYLEDYPSAGSEDAYGNDGNSSDYRQLVLVHRRDVNQSSVDSQGQKAIEDIKLRVLALTGRFNLTSNNNQIQRERLTMFSPTCQIPKNTDSDVWMDPFLMNMHFQLNLTSADHVVAAKLRIFKLPQANFTQSSTTSVLEADDEEEKKIRISIYFYTKSLKKHRSKKRLIDSLVAPLTAEGSHLALDAREALRFWRQAPKNHNSNTNNHGLVIQVEDQDGRPQKPALYIQQDSCHASELSADDKAYQRIPALFLQACSRYVRVVKDETVIYVNCKRKRKHMGH